MSLPIFYTPTLANGMAMGPAESAFPRLWDGLALLYLPSAGITGGRLHDYSGRRRHATFSGFDGGMSSTSGWSGGQCGTSLNLDGSNDFAQTGFVSNWTQASSFTLWAAIRTSDSDRGIVFGDYTAFSAGNPGVSMEVTAAGKLRAFLFTGNTSSYKDYSGNITVNDGLWHQIAIVWDGPTSTLSLYVDGKAQTLTKTQDGALSGGLSHSNGCRVGIDNRSSPGVVYFAGGILGVGVWDRALTPQEIFEMWEGASPATPSRRLFERAPAASGLLTLNFSDAIGLTDSVAKSPTIIFAEALLLIDSLAKKPTKAFTDALALSDGSAKAISKLIAEALGLHDSIILPEGEAIAMAVNIWLAIYRGTTWLAEPRETTWRALAE